MNIDEVYASASDYLKAADLQKPDGSFRVVEGVIDHVEVKDLAKEEDRNAGRHQNKVVLSLSGKDKAVVLNKTNGLRLAGSFGKETDGWVGKKVLITASLKSFGNDIVPGIDVSAPLVVDAPAEEEDIPF